MISVASAACKGAPCRAEERTVSRRGWASADYTGPMRTLLRVTSLLTLAVALSACGNKGPLVLPDKTASRAADAQPAAPATPGSAADDSASPASTASPAH